MEDDRFHLLDFTLRVNAGHLALSLPPPGIMSACLERPDRELRICARKSSETELTGTETALDLGRLLLVDGCARLARSG